MHERIACVLGIVTNTSAHFLSFSLLIRCTLDTSASAMLMYKRAVSIPFLSIFSFKFLFRCCCSGKKTFEWHVFLLVYASLALCKNKKKLKRRNEEKLELLKVFLLELFLELITSFYSFCFFNLLRARAIS